MQNAPERMNGSGTSGSIAPNLTQNGSRDVLSNTCRDLIALRVKHGAESPIGRRCSNIIELLKMPELPTHLISRQMADLQRLLAAQ